MTVQSERLKSGLCAAADCTGCAACAQACPRGCIEMRPDTEGFLRPKVDLPACVECGLCARVCPSLQETPKSAGDFYMAWHRDADVVARSSSGGAFTALAEWVLSRDGVVFGAEMNPKTREVRHVMIKTAAELDRLRLSKYIQSAIGDAYRQARQMLAAGRYVLFSGTACQIAGLYAFLNIGGGGVS